MYIDYQMVQTSIALLYNKKWLISLLLAVCLILVISHPIVTSAFASFGGYISEQMLGDGTNEFLHLGDGTNELTVLGSSPAISTMPVANNTSVGGVASATLRGNLQSLNSMPQADVWFVWGYNPAAMVNTTAVNTVAVIGVQTANINPANIGDTVYYQFQASTDGIALGNTVSFVAGGGHGLSYWMMNTMLPIIIACGILVAVLMITGNPIAAFLASITGIIAFYLVQALVQML